MKTTTKLAIGSILADFVFWFLVPIILYGGKEDTQLSIDQTQATIYNDVAQVICQFDDHDESGIFKHDNYNIFLNIVVDEQQHGIKIEVPQEIIHVSATQAGAGRQGKIVKLRYTDQFQKMNEEGYLYVVTKHPIEDQKYDARRHGYVTHNIEITLKTNKATTMAMLNSLNSKQKRLKLWHDSRLYVIGLDTDELHFNTNSVLSLKNCKIAKAVIDCQETYCYLEHSSIDDLTFNIRKDAEGYSRSNLSLSDSTHVGTLHIHGAGMIDVEEQYYDHIVYEPSTRDTADINLVGLCEKRVIK